MPRLLDAWPAPAAPMARHLANEAARLTAAYGERPAEEILRLVIGEEIAGPVALVSSFGAESAILLDLAAAVDRAVPVIFIDSGRMFAETLAYRDALTARLGLTDVRTIGPTLAEAEARDPHGALFAIDPDRCCGFRKVAPLNEALQPFGAWITGRKRHQSAVRAAVAMFEADATHIKINPLAAWMPDEIAAYLRARDLPLHPLIARGYASIGCRPCTTIVETGESARAGRWRGMQKTECGIHAGVVRGGGDGI